MGRLRARLAKHPADRELHGQLSLAQHSIEKALDVCVRVGRERAISAGSYRDKAKQAQAVLRQVLGMLDKIGYLHSQGDDDTPLKKITRKKGKPLDEQADQLDYENPAWLEEYLMEGLGLELEQ